MMSVVSGSSAAVTPAFGELEEHRRELTAYCYRMLGSPFDAEDAVQDAFLRAWRALDRFEGRAALRSWLYRIATNVCLDMLNGRERRARPMDLGPAREPVIENLDSLPEVTWIEPVPDGLVTLEGDPADVAVSRETMRLAFVAALQYLPPRQRAVLILCEVLNWKATEVAELLETSVASVNSALQRARATLETKGPASPADAVTRLDAPDKELLARYVEAFERYDMEALTSLIHEDATQSMPPYCLWLRGRDDILTWWLGPGIGCSGSRVIPAPNANGLPAFGQYKPSETGEGYDPWALQVLHIDDGRIVELTFFLGTDDALPALRPASAAGGVAASCAGRTSRSPMNATRSRSSADALQSRSSQPARRATSWRRATPPPSPHPRRFRRRRRRRSSSQQGPPPARGVIGGGAMSSRARDGLHSHTLDWRQQWARWWSRSSSRSTA